MFDSLILASLLILLIAVDFLMEVSSARMTLATGRLQTKIFNLLGRSSALDFGISAIFQLLSFRKQSYFIQLVSFFNVGFFSKTQIFWVLSGSFFGLGISCLVFLMLNVQLAIGLICMGFAIHLIGRESWRDRGVAIFSVGAMLISVCIFNNFLDQSDLKLTDPQNYYGIIFCGAFVVSYFFRTQGPFLLFISYWHFVSEIQPALLAVLFATHTFSVLGPFLLNSVKMRRRLSFPLKVAVSLIAVQGLTAAAVFHWLLPFLEWESRTSFSSAVIFVSGIYFAYYFLSSCLSPLLFLFFRKAVLEEDRYRGHQKIISPQYIHKVYSVHMSLFLLKQEFVKLITLVHTMFKMGRDLEEQEPVWDRLEKYNLILSRVAMELKELCFAVGKQRAYRESVAEILTYYKTINQIEILAEDLSQVIQCLGKEKQNLGDLRDYRYWLSLQLQIYESYFYRISEVEEEDPVKKCLRLVEKSYQVLEKIKNKPKGSESLGSLTNILYRVTESNGSLNLGRDARKVEGHLV